MKYNIIQTGSKGNAVLIDDIILIDCGVPFKKLKDYYKNIQLVLISHIHGDHFNKATVKKLAQDRPTLRFGVGSWLVNDLIECGVNIKNIDIIKETFTDYGILLVAGVLLHHDVENFGFKIVRNNERLIYITDTDNLNNINAKNYDIYLIEANYREDEIKAKIEQKELNGKYAYEKRVLDTHLSEEQATEWLIQNAFKECAVGYLHQHKEV